MLAVPAAGRGRVFGLAQADIIVQGAAILLAGGGGAARHPRTRGCERRRVWARRRPCC